MLLIRRKLVLEGLPMKMISCLFCLTDVNGAEIISQLYIFSRR